jgi:indole-3-glycerol phosphate synthase
MNILEQIVEKKKTEVAMRKELFPVKYLEKSIFYETIPVSLKKYLLRPGSSQIIAEFKRKSPSKGMINTYADVEKISVGYMQAGAAALSILTDTEFFGGTSQDLQLARKFNFCPILRKDFIVEEYQVIEAKSIGADVVLLIAAILKPDEIKHLALLAKQLGMEVLLEIHTKEELENIDLTNIDLVGVNNRNLKTFEVSVNTSLMLSEIIPTDKIKISESGISDVDTIAKLKQAGYQGFLMGENFMKQPRPEIAARQFIQSLAKQTIV